MRLSLLFIFLCLSSQAIACLQQEAQIIAQISEVVKTPSSCTAIVKSEDIRFFAPSLICPLDQAEVVSFGVKVSVINGHDCSLDVGDDLNGVVVRTEGGDIYLE